MPRQTLSSERIRELAKEGADRLLKQLRAEIIAVERTFPELALPKGRTSRMSAAARKEVSARMKKYWEERRKAKAKVR